MNKFTSLILFLIFISVSAQSQQKKAIGQFRLAGETDTVLKKLTISFSGKNHEIPVVKGKYTFQIDSIFSPQFATLWSQDFVQVNLMIASGQNLFISNKRNSKIKQDVSGEGAAFNNFRGKLDSIINSDIKFAIDNFMDTASFSKALNYRKNAVDILIRDIFSNIRKPSADELWFCHAIKMDRSFNRMITLTGYLIANMNKLSFAAKQELYQKHNNEEIIGKDPFKKENFQYPSFEYFISDGTGYLGYLTNMNLRQGIGKDDPEYSINIIQDAYQDEEVGDNALKRQLAIRISMIQDSATLVKEFPLINKHLDKFKSKSDAENFKLELASKSKHYIRNAVGNPAPPFNLKDTKGSSHSLADFKGKVVYLDLWASWCIPCREEIPFFKALYEKYKNDNRIKFISIAVNDKDSDWRKAVNDDKPTWLQLFDNGIVEDGYQANAIPRFVLIDKLGNISNFNAPRPSSGFELESLILSEMKKN